MGTRIASRLGTGLIVILGVTSIVFVMLHLIPGDPVEVMLGEYASAADRDALRQSLRLDRPLLMQWLDFLRGIAHLDLGESVYSRRPVTALLAERMPLPLVLAFAALVVAVAVAVGLPLGAAAAVWSHSRWDVAATTLAVVGMSLPNFVLGPLLIIVFSVHLRWFPVGGADGVLSIVLPAVTLGVSLAAILARMTRAALLDILHQEYPTAARARGLPEHRIIVVHACRNAALPVATIIGLQLGTLLEGAVITEMVFGWPGIGQLTIEAIHRRDYPVVQGGILLISFAYVLINMATDTAYGYIDPRIEL